MAESQIMSVIRVWAAIAWADGVLAEAEAEGLRRLITTAELTAEERTAARELLETKTAMPETYLNTLKPEARRGIYRAACRMAVVDHVFSTSERSMLEKLRDLLGIPPETAQEIEADVLGLV
ncbi:MAG: TerB family tellurite resistance protein [Deltaproteobacteria bacterium]|nr:TerB family tellurite resistance protein [Deltaproteobacteria bacterium]